MRYFNYQALAELFAECDEKILADNLDYLKSQLYGANCMLVALVQDELKTAIEQKDDLLKHKAVSFIFVLERELDTGIIRLFESDIIGSIQVKSQEIITSRLTIKTPPIIAAACHNNLLYVATAHNHIAYYDMNNGDLLRDLPIDVNITDVTVKNSNLYVLGAGNNIYKINDDFTYEYTANLRLYYPILKFVAFDDGWLGLTEKHFLIFNNWFGVEQCINLKDMISHPVKNISINGDDLYILSDKLVSVFKKQGG